MTFANLAPMRPATFLHVVLPVALGTTIYLLWRSPALRVFGWIEVIGISGLVSACRVLVRSSGIHPPSAVVYSLPDGLWVYAITWTMTQLWRREPRGFGRHLWKASGLFLALATELCQAHGLVRGTFDFTDVIVSIIGAAAAFFPTFLRTAYDYANLEASLHIGSDTRHLHAASVRE
jgi:hypothetical protein